MRRRYRPKRVEDEVLRLTRRREASRAIVSSAAAVGTLTFVHPPLAALGCDSRRCHCTCHVLCVMSYVACAVPLRWRRSRGGQLGDVKRHAHSSAQPRQLVRSRLYNHRWPHLAAMRSAFSSGFKHPASPRTVRLRSGVGLKSSGRVYQIVLEPWLLRITTICLLSHSYLHDTSQLNRRIHTILWAWRWPSKIVMQTSRSQQ